MGVGLRLFGREKPVTTDCPFQNITAGGVFSLPARFCVDECLRFGPVDPPSSRRTFAYSGPPRNDQETALPAMPAAPFLFLAGGYGSSLSFSTASTAITS